MIRTGIAAFAATLLAVGDKLMRENPRTKDMYELMLATAAKHKK